MWRTGQPERGAEQLARTWRSFLALGAGNYGAMVVALGTNALLARRLGAEQFGHLALLLMASQVLLLAAVNWSHAGFVRFGAQEFASRGEVAETLWTRLGIVWPVAALGVAGIVIFRQPLAVYLGSPAAAVWLLLVHFVAVCALSLIGAVFQARGQMARYGTCLFLDKSAMLLCVVALPAAWTGSAMTALSCYAASSLAVAIWGISVVGGRALRPRWPGRAAYRSMWLFSAPLLLTSWAGFFGTNWFDLVILKWHVPMAGIGMYSLATQLAGVVQQITVIFATLLLPELSVMVHEGQHARIRMLMERLLPYWLLATSILFTLVLLGARVGVPLVFGPSYAGAVPALALLMVASCALAVFNACTSLAGAFGSTWMLAGVAFASTTVNVVMDLVLIPRFGITGSAMATVLAYGTAAALVLIFVQKKIGGRIFRLAWLGTPALVAYACCALLDGLWFYPAVMVSGAINVFALVVLFGLFRAEDAALLKGLRVRMPFGLGAESPAGKAL
jgi:O-antigen/teichoic acid export membrane protein